MSAVYRCACCGFTHPTVQRFKRWTPGRSEIPSWICRSEKRCIARSERGRANE